jgi:NitT/TauT family transport system substrate-binding protein
MKKTEYPNQMVGMMTFVTRRQFLGLTAGSMAAVFAGVGLSGCSRKEPFVRIASNIWPGYEFLYLARDREYFSKEQVRMVEMPSASVCIEALAAGTVEGACLTLDEVLTARSEGLELTVVAVLDISIGADVLLVRPEIKTLQELKGHRIGVEQSAVGAVMLDAILRKAGLKSEELQIVHINVNKHRNAYINGEVDALITFEPVVSQLSNKKPSMLFSSADIPGRIIDVIAVRPEVLEVSPVAVQQLVAGHFRAREEFLKNPEKVSTILARRLNLNPEDVPTILRGIDLPDVTENHEFLSGESPKLENSASELVQIMIDAQLLPHKVGVADLADGRFLPKR